MRKTGKRILCMVLALAAVLGVCPSSALAVRGEPVPLREAGTYRFTSSGGGNRQAYDSFCFEEAYFLSPSSEECLPLAELSAQLALASTSWYGEEEDPLELDPSENAFNLVSLLKKMGFEDVECNAYYALEEMEDSIAVAVAHRSVPGPDGTCTLLAVIPRSAGYKQEWAGDFRIGADGMHEGFRAARDEVLRFVKQYTERHGIRGSIKVWTAGHSRGAAVANLVAGFLAGGGAGYLGRDVRIDPEDVYCYGTATPRVIRNGIPRQEELSVSGPRGGEYAWDTPGEPFVFQDGGACDPGGPDYAGIRNYALTRDLISALPPEEWGYGRYGSSILLDTDPSVREPMLRELSGLHPGAYALLAGGQGWYAFDPAAMQPVPDPESAETGINRFFAERLTGLLESIPTAEVYVTEGYQEAFVSVGGIYGMLKALLKGRSEEPAKGLKKALAYSYLAYAAERLRAEGRAGSDGEAVAAALAELLSFAAGEELDPKTCTVDGFAALLAEFVSERTEVPAVRETITSAAAAFPQDSIFWIRFLFSSFQKTYSFTNPVPDDELLLSYILACARGPEPGTGAANSYRDAAAVRRSLYSLLDRSLGAKAPGLSRAIGNSGAGLDGSGSLAGFVEALMPVILTEKDENGSVVRVYGSIAEAADGLLAEAAKTWLLGIADEAGRIYGDRYGADAKRHVLSLAGSAAACRRAGSYALFYTEGKPFDTADNIRSACTAWSLAKAAAATHYSESYLSWIRAVRGNRE